MSASYDPLAAEALEQGLADEVAAELSGSDDREAASKALGALAEALGEDDPAPLDDPGLPQDYRVQDVLGHGASGVVYRAVQQSLGREVAVKVLMPGGNVRDTERLEGEARRLAGLRHPAIVGIHEVGRARVGVYLTLELYARSLHDALREGPLNPTRAARIVRQVAEGIAYTHAHGVVHLDLKPGNVLLDAQDQAAVGDFGLAREVDGLAKTRSGAGLLGTPAFMAPEQAADRRPEIGERTDVYGLGALLYACLAGRGPFEHTGLADMLQAVRFEDPEPLEFGSPPAPRDLAAIANKAMAKDPSARYASASALAADLVRFEAGEPVEARLPGPWKKLGRGALRLRREIAVGFAGAAFAAVSLAPDRTSDRRSGEAWLLAGQELIEVGEPVAAGLYLAKEPRWAQLDERQRQRAELLRQRAGSLAAVDGQAPEEAEAKIPEHAQMLGFGPADWDWLVGLLGEERTDWTELRARDPLQASRTWRDLLGDLAKLEPEASAEDQARIARLVEDLPHWSWENGFAGWFEGAAPRGVQALLARLRKEVDWPVPEEACEVGVQLWFFGEQGRAESGGVWTGVATGEEKLRITGSSRTTLPVARNHFGMDLLRAAPPFVPRARPGDGRFELDGYLVETPSGAYWQIRDCEVFLDVPGAEGGWFVDNATSGLLAGSAEIVAIRIVPWGDTWTAVAMLVEIAQPGEALSFGQGQSPDLDHWRERIGERLLGEMERLGRLRGRDLRASPALRAGLIDGARSLAILGAGSHIAQLEQAQARNLARDEGSMGEISKGFAKASTYTTVTSAGADLPTWIVLAGSSSSASPGAVLDSLPLPGSAFSGKSERSRGWKEWITVCYLIAALSSLAIWTRRPRGSAAQLRYLASALLWSALCLDKTLLPALGSLPLDSLACLLLSLACWALRPWAGGWAAGAATLFAAALIQELVPALTVWPRVPLALGFVGLLGLAHRLDPRTRSVAIWSAFGVLFLLLYGLLVWQPWQLDRGGQRTLFLAYIGVSILLVGRAGVAGWARAEADCESGAR